MTAEPEDGETAVRVCRNCKSLLTNDVVFCPDCGAYQGQPGIDEAGDPKPGPRPDSANQAATAQPGMRACPHCGLAVSDIATGCTYCFRSLDPVVPVSGPELKRASPTLVWILMGGAGLIILAYIVFEILGFVIALHAAH